MRGVVQNYVNFNKILSKNTQKRRAILGQRIQNAGVCLIIMYTNHRRRHKCRNLFLKTIFFYKHSSLQFDHHRYKRLFVVKTSCPKLSKGYWFNARLVKFVAQATTFNMQLWKISLSARTQNRMSSLNAISTLLKSTCLVEKPTSGQ